MTSLMSGEGLYNGRALQDGEPGSTSKDDLLADPRKPKMSDQDIIREHKRCVREYKHYFDLQHARWRENYKFVRGSIHSEEEIDYARRTGMPTWNMNDAGRIILSHSGRQVTQRVVAKLESRGRHSQDAIDIDEAVARWERERSQEESVISQSFRDLHICGVSALVDQVSFREGPIPISKPVAAPIYEFMWDPVAASPNIQDRSWATRTRKLTRDQFLDLFGRDSLYAFNSTQSPGGSGGSLADAQNSDANVRGVDGGHEPMDVAPASTSRTRTALVTEREWVELEGVYHLNFPGVPAEFESQVFPAEGTDADAAMMALQELEARSMLSQQVGQMAAQQGGSPPDVPDVIRELAPASFERFQELFIGRYGQRFEDYARSEGRKIRYAILCGNHVLRKGTRVENRFHFLFMTGQAYQGDSGYTEFESAVDRMKDPQRIGTRMINLFLYMLSVSPKSGYLHEPGAFEDAAKASEQMAVPGSNVEVLDASRIQPKPGVQMPPGLESLLGMARSLVAEQGGAMPDATGSGGDLRRISGKVFSSVAAAAALQSSREGDAIREFRIEHTRLRMARRRAYYSRSDVQRIVGPNLAPMVPKKEQWASIDDFDITVEEAPDEKTTKLEQARIWVDSGLWQAVQGTPSEPPPEVTAEILGSGMPPDLRDKWVRKMQDAEVTQGVLQQLAERLAALESAVGGEQAQPEGEA